MTSAEVIQHSTGLHNDLKTQTYYEYAVFVNAFVAVTFCS